MNEKLITIFGTRPEIIRLSCIIPKLDKHFDHKIINTYQNYTHNLNDVFLEQLDIKPDYSLDIPHDSYGTKVSNIISKTFDILQKEKPDKALILGDTYSGLAVLPATNLGIKIYHMEAGNRSGDWRMPEEKNRRIIDHLSDINLPYTEHSRRNLLMEGINPRKIFVTGNPIFEVLDYYKNSFSNSIVYNMGLKLHEYYLVTIHRDENVTNIQTIHNIFMALNELSKTSQVVLLAHPRLVEKMEHASLSSNIIVKESVGFFEFVGLQRYAKCVLTDSGTVPEECSYFGVPCVIVRDSTERPELVETCTMVSGTDTNTILDSVRIVEGDRSKKSNVQNVSDVVLRILRGIL